jgi:hypothetical protein
MAAAPGGPPCVTSAKSLALTKIIGSRQYVVARGLRWGLAVQALGVVPLIRFAGASPVFAAVASVAALFGIYLLFTLTAFAMRWPRKPVVPEQSIGFPAACQTLR